jgi:RNA polymerase sigma-70 factor (ECF subfamily)
MLTQSLLYPTHPIGSQLVALAQSMQNIFSIKTSSDATDSAATLTSGDIEKYYSKIYQAIAAYTAGTGLDPADLTQETFLKAHKHQHSFHGNASVYTWLYRIARNTCIDAMRKIKTERVNHPLISYDDMLYDPASSSPEIEQREDKRLLNEALSRVEESLRLLIVLKDLQGLPYHEIAEITEMNEGTVKSRLFRARVQLRQELIKSGYTP